MKTIVLASALAAAGLLVGSASGHPLHNKRQLITKVVYVTEVVAEVIVYVDETGEPFSTSTSMKVVNVVTSAVLPSSTSPTALPTSAVSTVSTSSSSSPSSSPSSPSASSSCSSSLSTSSSSSSSSSSSTSLSSVSSAAPESAPQPTSWEKADPTVAASSYELLASNTQSTTTSVTPTWIAPTTPSAIYNTAQESQSAFQSSSSAEPVPTDTVNLGSLPLGITWDVYTGSSQCKSEADIAAEFCKMKDYKMIRIYGMDCQQIPLAIQNALKNGQKLMGGAFLDASGGGEDVSQVIQAYKSAIDQYAGGNWDVIQLFSVENERVNDGRMTAAQVVDAIGKARAQLRQLGYNGPVGAVETAPAIIANPSICEASDIVMANIHAFFDPNTKAANAGSFVKGQVERVQAACNNKRVVVTESGWPHQGSPNGDAIPSTDNQHAALQSIRASFSGDLFVFSAFDSSWKADAVYTFNAERFWGVIP